MQTGGIRGEGTQRVWDISSQPGSEPREYIGKITGKRAEGRLGAGEATEGHVQGCKREGYRVQGKCMRACVGVLVAP